MKLVFRTQNSYPLRILQDEKNPASEVSCVILSKQWALSKENASMMKAVSVTAFS
jgi:hypothetical protein